MRLLSRKAVLTGIMSGVLLFVGTHSSGQPPGSIPPFYTQRLQIPVRGDDFAQPSAVVADPHTGEIFVADRLRNRLLIFDPKGRFRYQIPGGSAFRSPVDLAVDPEGYLFVLGQVSADIALLDFDGRLIRRIPLAGLPEDVRSPRFNSLSISSSGDSLYLMDVENDRLWITNRDGAIRDSIDMTVGRPQKEIEELRYGHIDIYGDTLLVPIPTDGLVHLFDLEGRAKGTIGASGSAECHTMFPAAAAVDDEGRVIILDQQRALFMTWDLARGVCLSEHYGFGNAPGAFYQPSDLALDTSGRLYVSQGFEGRIQVYEGARPASVQLAARLPSAADPLQASIADVESDESMTEEVGTEAIAERAPAEIEARGQEEKSRTEGLAPPPAPGDAASRLAESESPTEAERLTAIEQTVQAWANAWSGKRPDEYLGFYSDSFQTGRELSRSEWEEQRRNRLTRPRSIQVALAQVHPQLTAEDRAEVAFVQTYRSNLFADKVDKILILRREESEWKILAERVVRTYRE